MSIFRISELHSCFVEHKSELIWTFFAGSFDSNVLLALGCGFMCGFIIAKVTVWQRVMNICSICLLSCSHCLFLVATKFNSALLETKIYKQIFQWIFLSCPWIAIRKNNFGGSGGWFIEPFSLGGVLSGSMRTGHCEDVNLKSNKHI
jgi:hypothetical protein